MLAGTSRGEAMAKQYCNAKQALTTKPLLTCALLCLVSVAVLTPSATAELVPPVSATTIKCYGCDDNANMLSIQASIDPIIDPNIFSAGLEQ